MDYLFEYPSDLVSSFNSYLSMGEDLLVRRKELSQINATNDSKEADNDRKEENDEDMFAQITT